MTAIVTVTFNPVVEVSMGVNLIQRGAAPAHTSRNGIAGSKHAHLTLRVRATPSLLFDAERPLE
ncbi:hypothetical protein ABH944_001424 [Caballeronia udeis]|jgi:hypothetical protein|uniref:Uncharacterized protein n=1 Tax=Caballeronia udeis TaxID=1232866 RepID=A0ABW8MBT9_9BURK